MSSISPVMGNQNIIVDTAQGVYRGACQVIKNIKRMQGDPATFGRGIRIIGYVFAAIVPGSQETLQAKLSMADNLTDSMQVVNCAHVLANGKEEQTLFEKLGNITLMTSGVGSGILFMDQMSILSLPTVASETGKWNIFGSVTKGVIGRVSNIGAGIGYGFMGLDAAVKLNRAHKEIAAAQTPKDHTIASMKRSKALLDLVWNVAEVALKVLVIAAVFNPGFIILAGVVAAGLGICRFLYDQHISEEVKTINQLGNES